MKKIIKVRESDIRMIAELVLEQENSTPSEEWVKISAKEFLELMKLASYYTYGVSRLPKFRGKKIWIVGDLNLSGTPTKDLNGVGYIEGSLDISKTDIEDLSNVQVKGYTRDWDSGVSRKRDRLLRQRKMAEAQSRREDNEWSLDNPNIDDEGLAANALLSYLEGNKGIDIKTPEDFQRIQELEGVLENLEQKQSEYEDRGLDLTDVFADIEATQEEIDELSKKLDIYDLYPSGRHYNMTSFEIMGDYDFSGEEYAVGTEQEADESVRDYAEDAANDMENYFSRDFIESHIDTDEVVDYAEEFYNDDVRENPEAYFNDDDYELSDEQEKRLEEIDSLIDVLKNRLETLEDEVDEPSEISDAYDELQEKIDELEEEKDSIEPVIGEPSEDMIDNKVADLVYDVRRNPDDFLENFGLDKSNFIDKESLIEDVINSDGYSLISSYDGGYDSETIEGSLYIIIRTS